MSLDKGPTASCASTTQARFSRNQVLPSPEDDAAIAPGSTMRELTTHTAGDDTRTEAQAASAPPIKKPFLRIARSARVHALASSLVLASGASNRSERRLLDREVLLEAIRALAIVIRNSTGCLFCAWVANFCYSRGNIFSLQSSRHQSDKSLTVASLVWTSVLYAAIILLTQTTILAPLRFVARPDTPAGFAYCLRRLARESSGFYFATLVLTTGIGALVANVVPSHLRWLKVEFYMGNWFNHGYTAALVNVTRRIYRTETCKGQERYQLESTSATNMKRSESFWRTYTKTAPQSLFTMLAGLYVHIASLNRFYDDGTTLMVFTGVSLGIKILIQELTKLYVERRDIRQIRLMCTLVGLPTVLIDTQVRVMLLLGKQSAGYNVLSSVGMAVVELAMRIGKMVLMLYQIQRRKCAVERASTEMSSRCSSEHSFHQDPVSYSGESVTSVSKFERWRKQMMDFHTAEVMADMYAEYIAIGCSASILYFFCDHPKYVYASTIDFAATATPVSGSTSGGSADSSSGSGSVTSSSSGRVSALISLQLTLIAFQVVLELAVDFVCCAFEIAMGARFDTVHRFGSFLALMFMTIAVVNIGITSFLFLK